MELLEAKQRSNKVIIAGSREFNDYQLVCRALAEYQLLPTEVVCGGAKGADFQGAMWAAANNVPIARFPADWKKYGKSAGHIRNRQMAEYADTLLLFHVNDSPGSLNMKYEAIRAGLDVIVVEIQVRYHQVIRRHKPIEG